MHAFISTLQEYIRYAFIASTTEARLISAYSFTKLATAPTFSRQTNLVLLKFKSFSVFFYVISLILGNLVVLCVVLVWFGRLNFLLKSLNSELGLVAGNVVIN